jgi:putative tributyrin esterase
MNRFTVVFILVFLSAHAVFAAKVDTLQIESIAMHKNYKAAVVLPNSYSKSKVAYPVLYLLHGAYGHFSDWLRNTPNKNLVKDLSDQYDLIIVMPEGETFSFYLDSPINKESQFETFITKEVIQKVDKTYRTIADKRARAITGLSMGGHGALYLSGKHPELFCAAGSMSGVVDVEVMLNRDASAKIKQLMQTVFGTQSDNPETFRAYSVIRMIDLFKANKLPLVLDCGVDDFLIEPNRELHRRLVYSKVPHEYTERPGSHTWGYWQDALPYHVYYFSKILSKE